MGEGEGRLGLGRGQRGLQRVCDIFFLLENLELNMEYVNVLNVARGGIFWKDTTAHSLPGGAPCT